MFTGILLENDIWRLQVSPNTSVIVLESAGLALANFIELVKCPFKERWIDACKFHRTRRVSREVGWCLQVSSESLVDACRCHPRAWFMLAGVIRELGWCLQVSSKNLVYACRCYPRTWLMLAGAIRELIWCLPVSSTSLIDACMCQPRAWLMLAGVNRELDWCLQVSSKTPNKLL